MSVTIRNASRMMQVIPLSRDTAPQRLMVDRVDYGNQKTGKDAKLSVDPGIRKERLMVGRSLIVPVGAPVEGLPTEYAYDPEVVKRRKAGLITVELVDDAKVVGVASKLPEPPVPEPVVTEAPAPEPDEPVVVIDETTDEPLAATSKNTAPTSGRGKNRSAG